MSQILEALAFDQVGFQHRAGQAIHLMQHALQLVQVFILRLRACWFPRGGRQVDDLAGFMALNGGIPVLQAYREFTGQFLIAEERLLVLFAFTFDLHSSYVEITQPPGDPNGA